MKLYYLPGACPLASHIVLEWIGQPYEAEAVSRQALKEPAFLALNPLGSVPVFTDGDLVLTQSSAILEYLADKYPVAGLMPGDIRERAKARRWLAFVNADVHKAFGLVFGRMAFGADPAVQAQVAATGTEKAVQLLAILDAQLAGQEWVCGQRSLVDPYLYTVLRWAHMLKVDLSGFANLQAFYQRMDADPGVRAAVAAQGLQ